jgi:hypothetical protein
LAHSSNIEEYNMVAKRERLDTIMRHEERGDLQLD